MAKSTNSGWHETVNSSYMRRMIVRLNCGPARRPGQRSTVLTRLSTTEFKGIGLFQIRQDVQCIAADYLTYFYTDFKEKYTDLCSKATFFFAHNAQTTHYALVSGNDELGYTVVTPNSGVLQTDTMPTDSYISTEMLQGRPGGCVDACTLCLDDSLDFGYILDRNELYMVGQGRIRSLRVSVTDEFVRATGEEAALVWAVLHHKGLREPSATLLVEEAFISQSKLAFEHYIEPIIRTFDICGTVTRDWYAFLAVAFATCVDTRPSMMLPLFAPYRRRIGADDLAEWINSLSVDRKWVSTPDRVTLLAYRIAMHNATPSPTIAFNPTTLRDFQFAAGTGRHIDPMALREDIARNYAAHLARVINHIAPKTFVEAVTDLVLRKATLENIFEQDEDANQGLFATFLKTVRCLADTDVLRNSDGTLITFSRIAPFIGGRNMANAFETNSAEWKEIVLKIATYDCLIRFQPHITPLQPPEPAPSLPEAAAPEAAASEAAAPEAAIPDVFPPMTFDQLLAMSDTDTDDE